MEKRVALIGIIVEDTTVTEELNRILHEYSPHIIGRMGVPHRERGINIISIAIDAPMNDISALSGKLGMLKGINVKTIYAKAGQGA